MAGSKPPSLALRLYRNRTITVSSGASKGVIVLDVIEGSDPQRLGMRGLQRAQRGQIQLGDVIVEIAGQAVGDEDDFANIMEQHKSGDVVTVKTLRDNRRLEYDIQLQAPITR